MATPPIKSMNLYSGADRVHKNIAALGLGPDDPLTVEILSRFDQLHYHGTDAIDVAIRDAAIGASDTILDIGGGWGGPARYLAHRTGARVTTVELQPDMHAVASDLTRRCRLSDKVDHICGDIVMAALPTGGFDVAVSWLALYHIDDHPKLYARLSDLMRPGARLHVEDLFGRAALTEDDHADLGQLYARTLASRDRYVATLAGAGFADIRFRDMTENWRDFTSARLAAFRRGRAEQVGVHGKKMVEALDVFYAAVARLFGRGNLGGVRLTAVRI